MQTRRVAITGIGAVSPLGNTVEQTWQNLMAGNSGMADINQFDARHFSTRFAAEVKNFQFPRQAKKRHHRHATSFTKFALSAATEAFDDAGIIPSHGDAKRWGVVAGSGMMTAEFEYLNRFQREVAPLGQPEWELLGEEEHGFFNLADFAKTQSNSGLSLLIEEFGIEGYANSVHTACASGGQALGLALQVIRRGDADCILAGGFDSMINPVGLSSFCLLGALSTYNETPQMASRPFDLTRNGFVLGEGAAFLILEEWEHAKRRGARIYAELRGEGNSLSSYRITDSHPNGDGAIQAIEGALKDGGLEPSDIDYINAHGTSTKMNDLSETNAIKAVFKDVSVPPVSSTKGQTGHLIAAAGALEAVISVKTIMTSLLPPTANLTTPDPDCDLDYVVDGPREKSVGAVLSNSFGFGGSNSCLLFTHPELKEA